MTPDDLRSLADAGSAMNRYAAALLLTMILAGLVACGSADNDPAQQRVEKPMPVETQR